MKRIWFTQQKQYDYMPLRAGLGQITPEHLKEYWLKKGIALGFGAYHQQTGVAPDWPELCPKIYTTRTRPLQGEYEVVEGSRYKATLVLPEIKFQVKNSSPLLLGAVTYPQHLNANATQRTKHLGNLTFPELDLGIRGSTFAELRDLLLRLNKKATMNTPFYVSHLEKLETIT